MEYEERKSLDSNVASGFASFLRVISLILIGSSQTSPRMTASPHSQSRNKHEQQGLFSGRGGSLPREGSPDKAGQYLKLEYPNGVIIHDTRNQGRIPK